MDTSTTRRQPRRGAALLAASLLPLTMSAALAEPSPIAVTVDPLRTGPQPYAVVRHQTVVYGDLDLETAAGLETFKQRITAAVRNVCTSSDRRDRYSMRDAHECRERAQARATADVARLDGAAAFGTR